MHCMDGKDYSVFGVLPPYNTIHAQLIQKGEPPTRIEAAVTLTYEAIADSTGSINTSSATKTNFWSYVGKLFNANVNANVGLTGIPVQSGTPQPMKFDSQLGVWSAEGIPTVPFDDAGARNAYPMAKVVARDANGSVLAQSTVVLAVSDEMSCNTCHASNSNPAARPAGGWENNPDALKDVKLNILKLHDDSVDATPFLPTLQSKGYTYQASLLATAKAGTPILCATCHATNALGMAGINPAAPLTSAMHTRHGSVVYPATGITLDNATSPADSCYLCHPGLNTKCQRGAMRATACFDCHGNLTYVGQPTRAGWLDVPACQMCHNSGARFTTTFASAGVWRTSTDVRFATNNNVPVPGKTLFRYSKGHGGANCSGCHGSPHAEYATTLASDNQYSLGLQGHVGKIDDCNVCHTNLPTQLDQGPHGLHTIGQSWVSGHHQYAEGSGYTRCAACHGSTYRGSALSQTSVARSFTVEGRTVNFSAGSQIGCYDCHNGPTGG